MNLDAVGPIADPTDSLLGWASQTEISLATALTNAPLAQVLCSATADHMERTDCLFGSFLRRQLAAGGQLDALVSVAPTLTAATLVARAVRTISPDSFLDEYLGGLNINPESFSLTTAEVAGAVQAALKAVGLAAPALDQAELWATCAGLLGMPVGCVPAVLELLEHGDAAATTASLQDGSYAEFFPTTESETEDGEVITVAYELPMLDQLAASHLEQVGEAVAGIAEIRAAFAAGQSGWETAAASLAPVLAGAVVAELNERPVGTIGRDTAVGVALRERSPRLVLKPQLGKICLRLPERPLNGREEIQWRVSFAGTTKIYRTGRVWGDGGGYSDALDITLEHQVREVHVADVTSNKTWNVPVVDFQDPLLVFSPRGNNVTDKASLHYATIWAVLPQDATAIDVVTGKPVPSLRSVAVEGWTGWSCQQLAVASVATVKAQRGKGQATALSSGVRCVDPRQRVTFIDPESGPVPALKSASGLKVYTESLLAEFPPTVSGETEIWQLTISAYGGLEHDGEEISPAEPLEVPAEGGQFAIFDPDTYDAPWVGEYLVRLKGPRGESFRHEFAIVEGLQAQVDYAGPSRHFRIPAGGGLSEASITIIPGEKHFSVSSKRTVVGPDAAGADVVITTDEGAALPLRFTPARLQFEVPLLSQPPMWRTTRLAALPRSFDPAGQLRIRGGGNLGDPRVTIRNHHGAPMGFTKLVKEDANTYVAPMANLLKSATIPLRGRLEFEWTDTAAGTRPSVNLAHIDPAPHASAVALDEATGVLTFSDLASDRDLAAWVWPLTAPWAPATTIAVPAAEVTLPEQLQQAGPLAIQLHSSDPYQVLRAPLMPGSNAIVVEQSGFYRDQPEALAELSAFLGNESETAPSQSVVMPLLWDCLSSWQQLPAAAAAPVEDEGSNQAALKMREAVVSALTANPTGALRGLSASLVPAQTQPALIIQSGLVGKPFADAHPDHELHRTAWIGTLQLLGQLPPLAEDALGDDEDATLAARQLRQATKQIAEVAGKTLAVTLKTGRDETLESARIDAATVHIASLAPQQQQALLGMMFADDMVPGPIMDDSARLLAVFETFKQRAELGKLLASQDLMKAAVKNLRVLKQVNRQLYSAAMVRFDQLDGVDTERPENLWALTPVVSLVFALSARMHAHGLISKSKITPAAAAGWAQLADIVPDLVTGDIVSAEAMVLAARYPGLFS